MSKSTIVLSVECVGMNRREALSVTGTIATGTVCKYVAGGVDNAVALDNVTALSGLISVENIATAQGVDYTYAQNENVFLQSLPRGTLVNLRTVDATYAAGDILEVGNGGLLQAIAAGTPFAVVPSFALAGALTGNDLLTVELI